MKLCLFCNGYKILSRYDGGMAIRHDVPFMSLSTAAVTGCREKDALYLSVDEFGIEHNNSL